MMRSLDHTGNLAILRRGDDSQNQNLTTDNEGNILSGLFSPDLTRRDNLSQLSSRLAQQSKDIKVD